MEVKTECKWVFKLNLSRVKLKFKTSQEQSKIKSAKINKPHFDKSVTIIVDLLPL